MSLPIPGVGTEAGPNYAQDVNDSLTLLDSHNHTLGQGTQIPTAGLNINADLTFNQFGITNSKHVSFTAQSSALTSVGTIYELNADLYFVDGNGNNVRITQSGAVAAAPGNITGLIAPASFTYVPSSSTFVAQSDVAVAANLDAGSLLMRNLSPNSTYALTLQPPTLTVDYSITLPVLPASQKIMTLDASGTMSAPYSLDNSTITAISDVLQVPTGGITATQIANGTITTTQISPTAGITANQIAAPGLSLNATKVSFTDINAYTFTATAPANATAGAVYTHNGTTWTVVNTVAAATEILLDVASIYNGIGPLPSGVLTLSSGTGDATIAFSSVVQGTNWTAPSGVTRIIVEAIGGGGGGGGGATGAQKGGGGAGAERSVSILTVTPGNSYNILIGAGGIPGSGPNSGLTAGDAVFDGQTLSYGALGGAGAGLGGAGAGARYVGSTTGGAAGADGQGTAQFFGGTAGFGPGGGGGGASFYGAGGGGGHSPGISPPPVPSTSYGVGGGGGAFGTAGAYGGNAAIFIHY